MEQGALLQIETQFLELVGCELDADHDVVTLAVVDDAVAETQAQSRTWMGGPPPTTLSTGGQRRCIATALTALGFCKSL